jgi:hypothetical protein
MKGLDPEVRDDSLDDNSLIGRCPTASDSLCYQWTTVANPLPGAENCNLLPPMAIVMVFADPEL